MIAKKIAIFASGAGSNAQKIINHFKAGSLAKVSLILCNKPDAGVFHIAKKEGIEAILLEKEQFKKDGYGKFLKEKGIDLVVLAGFLLKIPKPLIAIFPNKIINIHPALLPNYGGKGMYGQHVHEAVINNKETESGITIHYVDEQYDHGHIIFQAKCPVLDEDNADLLAQRIHALEHLHFPHIIEQILKNEN